MHFPDIPKKNSIYFSFHQKGIFFTNNMIKKSKFTEVLYKLRFKFCYTTQNRVVYFKEI